MSKKYVSYYVKWREVAKNGVILRKFMVQLVLFLKNKNILNISKF
jgi:hypothetical protein